MNNIFTFVKKFMSKYIHIIYIIAFITLSISLVKLYHYNTALENKINTISKLTHKGLKIDKLSSEKTFKEDYYITQQSNDTGLILTCFGAGLVIFSFLTFTGVTSSVSNEVNQMKKNYRKHRDEYKTQHNRLLELEIDINSLIGKLLNREAYEEFMKDKDTDLFLTKTLKSAKRYCIAYNYDKSEARDTYYEILILLIQQMESCVKNLDTPLSTKMSLEAYNSCVETIRETLNGKDRKMFNEVISKITLTNKN